MIYFTQDSSSFHVKIGYAIDAESRRKTLQTGNSAPLVILATMPGDRSTESALHRRFANDRIAGEWFYPTPALLLFILDVAAKNSPPFDVPASGVHRLRVYLAGKMVSSSFEEGMNCWRCKIVSGLPVVSTDDPAELAVLSIRERSIFGVHDYVGPYYFDGSNCGNAGWREYQFGDNSLDFVRFFDSRPEGEWRGPDGTLMSREDADHHITRAYDSIRRLSLDAIRRADVVFAWLDSIDCCTALAEIGYAHAIGRKIWIASPAPLPALCLVAGMAEWIDQNAPSPLDAFSRAVVWDAARSAMRKQ